MKIRLNRSTFVTGKKDLPPLTPVTRGRRLRSRKKILLREDTMKNEEIKDDRENNTIEKSNSRKSVRWSAVPVAPVFVYVSVMVRGAAAPKRPMT